MPRPSSRPSHDRAHLPVRARLAFAVTTLAIALGLVVILTPMSLDAWSPSVGEAQLRSGRDVASTPVVIDQIGTKADRVDAVPATAVASPLRPVARVTGRVVSAAGVPVEGATVIWMEEAWQCETAADGRFVIDPFSELAPLQGHVVAAHAVHGRSAPIAITDVGELRLVLDRAANPRLCGRVEFASGAPVVGCHVDVRRCSEAEPPLASPARWGAESGRVTTDARGEFCFAGLVDDPAGYSIRVAPELDELRADNVRLGGAPVVLRVKESVLVACRVIDETGSTSADAHLRVAAFVRSLADRVVRDPRDPALALLDEPDRTPIVTTPDEAARFQFWVTPATLLTLHARATARDERHEDAVEAMWIHAHPERIDHTIRVPPIAAQQGVRVHVELPVPAVASLLRCRITTDDAVFGGRESTRSTMLDRTGRDTFVSDLLPLRIGTHRLRIDFEAASDAPTLAPLEAEVAVAEGGITELRLRAGLGARIEVAVEQGARFAPVAAGQPSVSMRMSLGVECPRSPTQIRGVFDVNRPDDSRGFHAVHETDVVVPLDCALRIHVTSLRGDAATFAIDRVRGNVRQRLRLHLTLGSSGEPVSLRAD